MSLHLTGKPPLLSKANTAFSLNLSELAEFQQEETVIDLEVNQDGLCLGLIQWMDIGLFGEIRYENRPGEVVSHWPNPIYLLEKPLKVELGQKSHSQGDIV